MPRVACWNCGSQAYASASPVTPDLGERRCPGCGVQMSPERRVGERRQLVRRQNPPGDPVPPGAAERRAGGERRRWTRRRTG